MGMMNGCRLPDWAGFWNFSMWRSPTSRRPPNRLSLRRHLFVGEHVTAAMEGDQHFGLVSRIPQLMAELGDVHVDRPGKDPFRIQAPDVGEQFIPGNDPAGIGCKVMEEFSFAAGKLPAAAVGVFDFVIGKVHSAAVPSIYAHMVVTLYFQWTCNVLTL